MGYREFLQWQNFYALEPWGEWLNDLRFGQLAYLFASAWRSKDAEKISISDFVFQWSEIIKEIRESEQSDDEDESGAGEQDRFIAALERRLASQQAQEE